MKCRLFLPDATPGGVLCDCDIADLNVVAQSDDQDVRFPLRQAEVSLGGMDNAQIVLTHEGRKLYMPRFHWEKKLRALGLASLNTALQAAQSQARSGTRRWTATVAACMFSFVAAILLLVGASDLLIDRAVAVTPVQWEADFGETAGKSMVSGRPEFKGETRAQLQALFEDLTADFQKQGFHWHLYVIESKEENAFALPGGTVVVYTGLLKAASGPEELAGVLAHEIHHVVLRHGLRQVYGGLRWRLPLLLLGEEHTMRALLVQQSSLLADLSYGRGMERQAGTRGVDLLVAKGIDPHGLENFFQRSASREGVTRSLLKFQSTHPPSHERSQSLQAKLASLGPTSWKKMALDWDKLKKELP